MVHYFKPKTILELGTSLGIATHAIGLANPNSDITTIEGCSNISEFSIKNFETHQLKNIIVITGNFDDEIKKHNLNLTKKHF